MNILLINHYAGSPDMGMEFRPYYFAKEWLKMGHKVTIMAGNYSHLRIHNPSVQKDFQRQDIEGIRYCWMKTGEYEGNGAKRAFTMFRFVEKLWLNAKKIAETINPDVVIASSTYPLDTYAAQRIAKMSGARLIHEVHDMWPSTLCEIGGMPRCHPFVVLMQLAENSAYKHSSKVVSLPPLAKGYMIKHGMAEEKFLLIPNGILEEEWENPESLPKEHLESFKQLQANGKFIVGYFGGHALSNCLDTVLDVAKKIGDPEIFFVLVGEGAEKKRLLKRMESEKIDNVLFLKVISKKAIPSLLHEFDCIYISVSKSPLYRFGLCLNKMFDAMRSGKPILMSVTTPRCLVEETNAGIVTKAEDKNGIINGIKIIKAMPEEMRAEMGERGKRAILESYSYKKLAEKFEDSFKNGEKSDERKTFKKNCRKRNNRWCNRLRLCRSSSRCRESQNRL